jgi:hypothetical protein
MSRLEPLPPSLRESPSPLHDPTLRRRASATLAAIVIVLILVPPGLHPAHAIVISVAPPIVVGLFVDPDDPNRVAVRLRLDGQCRSRLGEFVVLQSTDGGSSFYKSTGAEVGSSLVRKPRHEFSIQFDTIADRAIHKLYALDQEAFLREHPALRPTRSARWTPLFTFLCLVSVVVPVIACSKTPGRRQLKPLATTGVLLFLSYTALTYVTLIRNMAVDIGAPTSSFFGVVLRCATEPLPLVVLFALITLFLPSSRLLLTHNRWRPLPLRTGVAFAWSALSFVFWTSFLNWSVLSAVYIL